MVGATVVDVVAMVERVEEGAVASVVGAAEGAGLVLGVCDGTAEEGGFDAWEQADDTRAATTATTARR